MEHWRMRSEDEAGEQHPTPRNHKRTLAVHHVAEATMPKTIS